MCWPWTGESQWGHKIKPFCDFVEAYDAAEVPDPYYGGAKALIECRTCLKMDAVSFLTIARFKGSEKQLGL